MNPMETSDSLRMTMVKKTILTCMLAALLVACGQKQETATTSSSSKVQTTAAQQASTSSAAATETSATAPAAVPPSQGKVTGKIAEAFNAAGYTYLRLQTANGEEWAAVPESATRTGQNVTVNVQMVAEKFESKTLNRKFDKIYFGNIEGAGPAPTAPGAIAMSTQPMPPNHPQVGGSPMGGGASAMGSPEQHMRAPEVGDVKVPKAEGGKTVAEIWAGKDGLKDREVVVRGKVVKFLAGIMGKNWLHLRDGSGSKEKGDDDITVTTNEMAAVGDVVTVKGKVSTDKDFGAGYRYGAIIEDAKLSK